VFTLFFGGPLFCERKAIMSLETLLRPDSLTLLRQLAPRLNDEPDEVLSSIAERLGDLPLALDLAGRYLEERASLLPQEYLAELISGASLLQYESLRSWAESSLTRHATNLAVTFALSWLRLDTADPADALARRLFLLAGYCAANDPIPPEMLRTAGKTPKQAPISEIRRPISRILAEQYGIYPYVVEPPKVEVNTPIPLLQRITQRLFRAKAAAPVEQVDPIFDRALWRLVNLGLLARNTAGSSIHPLLGEFARSLAADEPPAEEPVVEHVPLLRLANALADLAYQANESGQLQSFTLLRPHIEVVAPLCEAAKPELAAKLWNNLGGYLRLQLELSLARTCFQRALQIDEQVYGSEHAKLAGSLNNLGALLEDLGDPAGARELFERAVHNSERVSEPEDAELAISLLAISLNNLGSLLHSQGDLQEAKLHLERALQIGERVFGPERPEISGELNNLGLVLKDLGDLAGAKRLLERALHIDERAYGLQHPTLVGDLHNLSRVLYEQGNLLGAKQLLERALHVEERVYEPHHPAVATRLKNLVRVLQAQGDLQGAKKHLERAAKIDEQIYGPQHSTVFINLSQLGLVLQALGDLPGAKQHLERAVSIGEQVYGLEHPDVAGRLNILGSILHDMGDLQGARQNFERALQIGEKVYGSEHPNIAACLYNLGGVLKDLGDLQGAKDHFGRGLPIAEHIYGAEHPDIAMRLNSLGCVLIVLGDLVGAKQHLERALAIYKRILPAGHPTIHIVQANLEALRRKEEGSDQ
jgi:tetratricopeptide (TPR) repeat protein